MAEEQRQGELGKVNQPEILDLENHRGLYGRFLMASQAQPEEVPNIINPATPVEFNFAADKVPLERRNYNPVFENLSFDERKKEWRTVPLFNDAYSQWRTKFTDFMVNIQDPQRALALKTILSNNKEAKDFKAEDADNLFNEFCRGKSDINNFLKRVTANLTQGGKINSENLKSLLPHLQWIASGLFGRQTAGMVNGLVDLESQLHNNQAEVLAAFNSAKDRIKTPQAAEINALRDLYSLIPQEKVSGPAQKVEPVITADAPKPPPVIAQPNEDEGKAGPPTAPVPPPEPSAPAPPPAVRPIAGLRTTPRLPRTETPQPPPAPPVPENPPAAPPASAPASFFELVLRPAIDPNRADAPGETGTETGQSAKIEVIPILENQYGFVKLRINGEDSGIDWRQRIDAAKLVEDDFFIADISNVKGPLKIPSGIRLDIRLFRIGTVYVTGGENTEIDIDTLKYLREKGASFEISRDDGSSMHLYQKERGRAKFGDYIGPAGEAIALFKKFLEPTTTQPASPARTDRLSQRNFGGPENPRIVRMERGDPTKFSESLNRILEDTAFSRYERAIVTISPHQLRDYIISVYAQDYKAQAGDIEYSIDNTSIRINNIQFNIPKIGGTALFDLIISNGPDGITANIQNYGGGFRANRVREKVESGIKTIDSAVKERLKKNIAPVNSSWLPNNIRIEGGEVLITFNKTP